jgi:hypothetical protein
MTSSAAEDGYEHEREHECDHGRRKRGTSTMRAPFTVRVYV